MKCLTLNSLPEDKAAALKGEAHVFGEFVEVRVDRPPVHRTVENTPVSEHPTVDGAVDHEITGVLPGEVRRHDHLDLEAFVGGCFDEGEAALGLIQLRVRGCCPFVIWALSNARQPRL